MNGYAVKPLGVLLIGVVLVVTAYLIIRSFLGLWRLRGDDPPHLTALR